MTVTTTTATSMQSIMLELVLVPHSVYMDLRLCDGRATYISLRKTNYAIRVREARTIDKWARANTVARGGRTMSLDGGGGTAHTERRSRENAMRARANAATRAKRDYAGDTIHVLNHANSSRLCKVRRCRRRRARMTTTGKM